MKKPLQHTLIPSTAILILSGIVLLVALHLRQTKNLNIVTGRVASAQQTIQSADLLQHAWNAQSNFICRYLAGSAAIVADSLRFYQQEVAAALLQLQKIAATNPALNQQLQNSKQAMIGSESFADSLIALQQSGIALFKKEWEKEAALQTLSFVPTGLDAIKLSVYAAMQQQELRYMAAQKAIEHIRLGTLITLAVALIAFLYLLYQDVHAIINRKMQELSATPAATVQVTNSKRTVAQPQMPLRSRSLQLFFADDAQSREETAKAASISR